jgi:hypothetical protein
VLVLTAFTSLISNKIFTLSVDADSQMKMKNVALRASNSTITNSTKQTINNFITEERRVPSLGGKLTPETISGGNNSNGQILTTQMIAKQLTTITCDKVAIYPLKDLSSTDLVTVFSSISQTPLEKTLNCISDSNLAAILNKISIDKRQQILDRLSPDTKQQILDRLTGQLFK